MRSNGIKSRNKILSRAEKNAWKKWNRDYRPPRLTAEQTLTWLDGWREFMFEVWRCNPASRKRFEKLHSL